VRVRLRITVPVDRQFVVLDDPLPAGLEAVDLSLRTATTMAGLGAAPREDGGRGDNTEESGRGWYGSWDAGWWSPFDHKEIRDDRVVRCRDGATVGCLRSGRAGERRVVSRQ
jgi:uncharacterized protein YfaS (alpha-2-macroglobulin family)